MTFVWSLPQQNKRVGAAVTTRLPLLHVPLQMATHIEFALRIQDSSLCLVCVICTYNKDGGATFIQNNGN